MKCYYEELGVERDANDADIKSAYRKLALRWHPDKNLERLDEAKEHFLLIQQAYEVLSDSHERAWYDNHREQILRGKNSNYEENCLDVFQYFTVSCFKGYGDDAKGFYAVYSEVFGKIAVEDAEFLDDREEFANIPKFGNSQSNYDEVVGPFYAYWQAYCTKKTYTWLCPYDIQEIKDRRIVREIEKDLKKIVQKAKKERNEEVRNLVSFIRKRDKRVLAYRQQLEERAELNRQKQEKLRVEQIRKRQKELEEVRRNQSHSVNEAYEEQLKQLEQEYSSSEEEDEIVENLEELELDEYYTDDLYCVACNKSFGNDRAFANHESSKKHRENIERMKLEMEEDEEAFGENDDEEDENEIAANVVATELSDIDLDEYAALSDEEEQFTPVKTKKNKKTKKGNKSNAVNLKETTDEDEDLELNGPTAEAKADTDSEAEDWNKSSKKSAKKSKSKNKKPSKQVDETVKITDQEEDLELNGSAAEAKAAVLSDSETEDWNKSSKKSAKKTKSKSKKPSKKADEAATETIVKKAEETEDIVPINAESDETTPSTTAHACAVCKFHFSSKNKLFAHLKKTGHSVYIPKVGAEPPIAASSKKTKGKRK